MSIRLRLLSAALAAGMLLSFAACGESAGSAAVTTAAGEGAPDVTDAPETIDYESLSFLERLQIDYESVPDGLPAEDMGGAEIVIHDNAKALDKTLIGPDEMTGDIIDDATYERTREIEERFNCVIKAHIVNNEGDYSKYVSLMNSVFLSGDDVFDVMKIWNTTAVTFSQQGFLADLSQISTIRYDKPWIFSDATDMLSYKGHKFVSVDLLSGSGVYGNLLAVFFNKNRASNYQTADFYDAVRNGQWTYEFMASSAKSVYSDLNGNSKVDPKEDEFGYEFPVAANSFTLLPSMGLTIIGKEADDTPYLLPSQNIERFETIYSAIRSFVNDNDSVTYSDWGDNVFTSGRALFYSDTLNKISGMRDVNFDVGILPPYMFDEAQEGYKTCFLPNPSGIPSVCGDKERAGIILSAMAAGGYKKIAVPYFETVVKTKLTTDEDSAEMLDIMASSVTSDGVIMFTDAMIYTLLEFVRQKGEFASFWAKKETSAQKYIDKVCGFFDEFIG